MAIDAIAKINAFKRIDFIMATPKVIALSERQAFGALSLSVNLFAGSAEPKKRSLGCEE
jgi:hypothetical protein